ncbi:MAG: hypothetical protein RBT63_07690, partial [Bdellovibrionales bacterium]|nr:hypothetical protein [Bdellovibrionales bacterium]
MNQFSSSSATTAGTKRFFEKLKTGNAGSTFSFPPSRLGRTALMVSRVVFGGYRIHEHDPDHREAIKEAIRSGVNLIDKSSNYTYGSSERLIGQTLS